MMGGRLPNIILIVMDSVAAKRCSVYGHRRPTTPGLARIAADGVLYRWCFAPASWTLPSHVSLFSGLYPREHGCNTNDFTFPGNYYNLPEILREVGYRTVGISSNYVISRACNFNHGFDEFYEMDTLFNSDQYSKMRQSVKASRGSYKKGLGEIGFILRSAWENGYYAYPAKHLLDRLYRKLRGDVITKSCYATQRSVNLAKRVLKKSRGQPLFMFFNFMEAHATYNPPGKYRDLFRAEAAENNGLELLYEREIAFLDNRLFELYRFLKESGLADDTLFVVTADHGEGFGEHGITGHVFCVYNELIHIPLIVKYPAAYGMQGESTRLTQLHDLFATAMEAAEVPIPAPESSRSLLGPERDLVKVENLDTSFRLAKRFPGEPPPYSQPCLAVIDPDLTKLIRWADGRQELYDLKNDYPESVNLIDHPAHRDQAEYLASRLGDLPAALAAGEAA